AQGGDARALDRPDPALPRAPHVEPVRAARAGTVAAVRTFALGEIVVHIGAGRMKKEDAIDPAVGVVVRRRIGDRVAAGDVLAELPPGAPAADVTNAVRECFAVSDQPATPPPLVHDRLD